MKLTLKENMILNRVIGVYLINNCLLYGECKTLNKINNRLKEERKNKSVSSETREEVLKELRFYDIKAMMNNKWIKNV